MSILWLIMCLIMKKVIRIKRCSGKGGVVWKFAKQTFTASVVLKP